MASSSSRKCTSSQTRETIAKVYDFLDKDAKEILQLLKDPCYSAGPVLMCKLSDHLNVVRKRTAQATGVSERTVTRILTERRNDCKFKSPYKDRKKRAKKSEINEECYGGGLNGTEVGTKVGIEVGTKVGTEVGTEVETKVETEVKTEVETEVGTELFIFEVPKSEPNSESEWEVELT